MIYCGVSLFAPIQERLHPSLLSPDYHILTADPPFAPSIADFSFLLQPPSCFPVRAASSVASVVEPLKQMLCLVCLCEAQKCSACLLWQWRHPPTNLPKCLSCTWVQATSHELQVWIKLTPIDTLNFNLHLFYFQVDPCHKALRKHSYSSRCATKVSSISSFPSLSTVDHIGVDDCKHIS